MSFAKILKKLVAVVLAAVVMVTVIPVMDVHAGELWHTYNGAESTGLGGTYTEIQQIVSDTYTYTPNTTIDDPNGVIEVYSIDYSDNSSIIKYHLTGNMGSCTISTTFTSTTPDENGNLVVRPNSVSTTIKPIQPIGGSSNQGSQQPSNPSNVTACEHDYQEVITAATLEESGAIESKCTKCGKVESSEEITKVGSIKVSKATYNGKEQKPKVTIKDINGKLIDSKYYTLKYSNNKNAGKNASVKVTFQGVYSGVQDIKFSIRKANQNVDVNVSLDSVSEFWLKFFGKKGTITTKKAIGTVSYSSLNEDFVSIEDDGTFKIKRGTPKGEYGIVVTAKGDKNFKKFKKKITIVVD